MKRTSKSIAMIDDCLSEYGLILNSAKASQSLLWQRFPNGVPILGLALGLASLGSSVPSMFRSLLGPKWKGSLWKECARLRYSK